MYERIVVGTDGSQPALRAVRTAGRLAEMSGTSRIHVVTAAHPASAGELAEIQQSLPQEFHDLVSPFLDAEDRFDEARSILGSGVEVVAHLADRPPAESILAVADEVRADLVVVGARGLGAVE